MQKILFCLLLSFFWVITVWAGGYRVEPALSYENNDADIIEVLEILELMEIAENLELLKDMNILIEADKNEKTH